MSTHLSIQNWNLCSNGDDPENWKLPDNIKVTDEDIKAFGPQVADCESCRNLWTSVAWSEISKAAHEF